MKEEWKPVPEYEGRYEVSNMGLLRSITRTESQGNSARIMTGRVLSMFTKPTGHLTAGLSSGGIRRTVSVHRMVAQVFVPGYHPDLHVCHGDGNPKNNRADNLRWGTRSDNVQDSLKHGTHGQASKTHCPAGHTYDEENTTRFRNTRYCKKCSREHNRKSMARKRQAIAEEKAKES